MCSETATVGDRMAIGSAAFTIIIVSPADGAHHSSLHVALLAPVLFPMRRIRIGRLSLALRRRKMNWLQTCNRLVPFFYKTYQQNNQTSINETDSDTQPLRVDKPNKHVHVDQIKRDSDVRLESYGIHLTKIAKREHHRGIGRTTKRVPRRPIQKYTGFALLSYIQRRTRS
jgi:hypothetical protein